MVDIDIHPEFVSIVCADKPQTISFEHSFHSKPLFYQRIEPAGQTILKACSNKQRSIRNILDITAGWGLDGFILAQHGKQVTMLEQNPLLVKVLSASLENAGRCTRTASAASRITLKQCNSLDYLNTLDNRQNYDCIYMDPMFPERKSMARPSKELQILQKLTGNLAIDNCFELALQKAIYRVVVKRPLKAPCLTLEKPDFAYKEKSIRFDIYLTA